MKRFIRRYPSPSLVISITALVVSLGGAGYSATGGNFILGLSNSATSRTILTSNLNDRVLQLNNSSLGGGATGLSISVAPSRPPLTVNSSTKVANLNADRLDNLDSTQFPNRLVVPFSLAAFANSAPITPPPDRPVLVMGVTTSGNNQGAGQVILHRLPGNGLLWVGLESYPNAAITSSFSSFEGGHIVFLDYSQSVDIVVNSADTIRIHNGSNQAQTGTVTLIW